MTVVPNTAEDSLESKKSAEFATSSAPVIRPRGWRASRKGHLAGISGNYTGYDLD